MEQNCCCYPFNARNLKMNEHICILSTKKLRNNQKNFLLNADFSLIEADFIKITKLSFLLKEQPTLLLFTSQNGVFSVLQNEKAHELKQIPTICVGNKTKKLLLDNGFKVLQSREYAQELAPVILSDFSSEHIAFFAGNIRSDVLPAAMNRSGITFNEYIVYQNNESSVKIKAKTDGLLFFSPSGITSYLKKNTIENQMCFCIGTTTAKALEGITKNIVLSNRQTIENVIIQCIKYYKK